MLLYGMGPGKLGSQLDVDLEEAKELIDKFFSSYPLAKQWVDSVHAECKRDEVVWTIMNRPRRLREVRSRENWIVARTLRQAVNSIIQGSAADLVLQSMLNVDNDLLLKGLSCSLLLQVHDELVFEVPEHNVEQALRQVKKLMEYEPGPNLLVGLPVSIQAGDNWEECH